MSSDTALLIVDVQVGMFTEADPVYDGQALLERLRGLIGRARAASVPVVYIQHGSTREGHPLQIGTAGWHIHPAIEPQAGELVVQKRMPDSFFETRLDAQLYAGGISRLILTGIQTEVCVDTTCRRAVSLGYKVTLVADGHSTWDRQALSAPQIIAHHNATLGEWFATVLPAEQISLPVPVGERT